MKFSATLTAAVLVAGLAFAAHAQSQSKDTKAPTRDQLRTAVQGICPVSGQKLGSHGTPIKVAVGKDKEEVFLCCKGCLGKKIDAKHWGTIHANIARAQGKCPVMQKPLPKAPKWTVVKGQLVYVCCPPCTDKLAKDPAPYLKRIDGYYALATRKKSAGTR